MIDPNIEDKVSTIVAHLTITADAYLKGPEDFDGVFTLLDQATLTSKRAVDTLPVLPGDIVQRLESSGRIARFAVAEVGEIGFRIPQPEPFRKM